MLKIFCFSLYCEGGPHRVTKSQAFVSIRETEKEARWHAKAKNLRDFPIEAGWVNHQMSMIEISESNIASLIQERLENNVNF